MFACGLTPEGAGHARHRVDDAAILTAHVINTVDRAGSTVVQVYVGDFAARFHC